MMFWNCDFVRRCHHPHVGNHKMSPVIGFLYGRWCSEGLYSVSAASSKVLCTSSHSFRSNGEMQTTAYLAGK
jgi:hypothetical protein